MVSPGTRRTFYPGLALYLEKPEARVSKREREGCLTTGGEKDPFPACILELE